MIAACVAFATVSAIAAPEDAARLGGDELTCTGAIKAGTESGVAPYTGKWLGDWPGASAAQGFDPGPYAGEKPLFTITAANAEQYATHLTDGQKALFKKYPDVFRMPVYPSHRDFRYPDWVCEAVKKNVAAAKLTASGLGADHILGAIPFAFPTTGLEALFNIKRGFAGGLFSEDVVHTSAAMYANGAISWGKVRLKVLVPWNRPSKQGHAMSQDEPVEVHFYYEQFLPVRDKGTISVGNTPNDYGARKTEAWVYQPGLRRVRQLEDVAPDFPVPPAGFHTVDDEALFNGSPERFTWKLIGRQEVYVPYNNFHLNDPALRYKDILGPQTINPEHERYELHRLWVLEGTLRAGLRHVYGRRVLYADEDTWNALWADNYDTRGPLWRTAFSNYFYSPVAQTFHRGVTVYHDLLAGGYEAEYLVNESGKDWWQFNDKRMNEAMFTPAALAAKGH